MFLNILELNQNFEYSTFFFKKKKIFINFGYLCKMEGGGYKKENLDIKLKVYNKICW